MRVRALVLNVALALGALGALNSSNAFGASGATAEARGESLVVVVSARSEVAALSRDQVVNIFLGRYRQLPNGAAAVPIDQPESSALRSQFYRQLVNKNLAEINAYWSRLVFSGRTAPPRSAGSAQEVVAFLLANPGAIGYIERSQLDDRLTVVLDLRP